jgi:hypothetical protein
MMRKIAAFCTMFLATAMMATAQEKKEAPKSPPASAKSELAEVSYSQPSKKGRVIFGELVPYGEVWRTGANMSTDITFKTDVMFGGREVKQGTYSLFTIPGEKEWTVILNGVPAQRGASQYNDTKDKNVAEVKVRAEQTSTVEEKFTIDFEGQDLVIKWDLTKVKVPITKK